MLVFSVGERYDIVLSADQPVGNYWMRAYCNKVKFNILAVVRYEGAPVELPREPEDTRSISGRVPESFTWLLLNVNETQPRVRDI